MLSYKLKEVSLGYLKLVVVQSGFVGNLVGNELSVVSCWNALVNNFLLLWVDKKVSVNELSHLNVVSEDVERQVDTSSCSAKALPAKVGLLKHFEL